METLFKKDSSGNITEVSKEQLDLQTFDTSINTEEKKKRGRKPGTAVKKEKDTGKLPSFSIFDKNICRLVATVFPFALLGEGYKLSDEEKEELAPLWGNVLNKYVPETVSKYSDEFALAIGIGLIYMKKSGIDKQLGLG